jgi:hypothetical protein
VLVSLDDVAKLHRKRDPVRWKAFRQSVLMKSLLRLLLEVAISPRQRQIQLVTKSV